MSSPTLKRLQSAERGSLKCTAVRGMFPHEVDIAIRGKNGGWYESMMDSNLVDLEGDFEDDSEREGKVEVSIVGRTDDAVLVELPRQVIGGGRRIWVPAAEVR